jgi:uncharacterized protein YggE
MKKYMGAIAIMIACTGMSMPANAEKVSRPAADASCPMSETATVSINFNGFDKDIAAIKLRLDAKIDGVKALAEEQHFDKFDIQSINYNINSNYNNGDGDSMYQYNGNASFQILPAARAFDFMAVLAKKGYHANVNVSSNRNGNCNPIMQ